MVVIGNGNLLNYICRQLDGFCPYQIIDISANNNYDIAQNDDKLSDWVTNSISQTGSRRKND